MASLKAILIVILIKTSNHPLFSSSHSLSPSFFIAHSSNPKTDSSFNRLNRLNLPNRFSLRQRGIIKSRPLAGVKSSAFQFSRQVKDIKSSPLEELQTERTTVIASTRPAPESASVTAAIGSSTGIQNASQQHANQPDASQQVNKQTTPSVPISSTTVNSEASDQLVRRSSLGKTNPKSGKLYRLHFRHLNRFFNAKIDSPSCVS